jgi:anti-anti-sigma factor
MAIQRADLHIHTTYSDGLLEPEDAVNFAVTQTDLRVICITDHNTIDGALHARDYWQSNRDAFAKVQVVVGEEISSLDGHILGLFLHDAVPPHLSAADTVRAIHEQGGIAIAAHPFTHLLIGTDMKGVGRHLAELPVDGVEVRNSAPTELYANWLTAAYNARTRRHPAVGGSDCHYLPMMGQAYTRFEGVTADDLRAAFGAGAVRPGGSIVGPRLVLQFARDQLRKRQLPMILPNDHRYRYASPGLSLEVDELRSAPIAVVHCQGRLIRDNADLLKAKMGQLLDGGLTRQVVDLAQVTFVDSSGMGALVVGLKRLRGGEGELALSGVSKDVLRSLQLVRLDKVFLIRPTWAEAVEALQTRTGDAHGR